MNDHKPFLCEAEDVCHALKRRIVALEAILSNALERLEASQPPEGGATANLCREIREALEP